MKSDLQKLLGQWGAGLFSALAVGFVFLPVLNSDYGIYDAVRMLLDFGWTGESRLMGVMIGGGRFVYAVLAEWGFRSIHFIDELWILRMIGVVSLIVCSVSITLHARRHGWGSLSAICIGLVALINPGVTVFGFWSACFPYGLGILAGFHAGNLWARDRWGPRIVSILLMQVALSVYQPAALFFFLGPFLSWFGDREHPARPFPAVWCFLGILLNLLVHVVLLRLVLSLFPDIPGQSARLIQGGSSSVLWHLLHVVVPRVFYGWGDLFSTTTAVACAVVFVAGWILFLAGTRGPGDRWTRLISLIPVALTLLPAIVSADGYTPYRLLAPAYCAVGVVAVAGFMRSMRFSLPQPVVVAILGLSLLCAGSVAVRFGIVRPRSSELEVIRNAIKECGSSRPVTGMFIIRPEGTYPFDRYIVQKGEYGAYELTYGGFSEAYMSLIAARLYDWSPGELNPINQVHWVFYPANVEAVPPFYPVLDLRERLQGMRVFPLAVSQGTTVNHPYLGDTLFFPPSLYMTPGFGLSQQVADRWFFLPGQGWMQWTSEPGQKPLTARNTAGEQVRLNAP